MEPIYVPAAQVAVQGRVIRRAAQIQIINLVRISSFSVSIHHLAQTTIWTARIRALNHFLSFMDDHGR